VIDQGITPKLFNQIAQAGHFAGGAAIVFGLVVLTHHHSFAWPAFLIVLALAGVKEFWYDEKYETAEVRGSSVEDFVFYAFGAGFAAILSYVASLY
jgi:hypothetical protein